MSDHIMPNDEASDGGASLPPACAAFDAALADYLEGDLDPAARAVVESHRAGCARCAALAADLAAIAAGARALPPLRPSAAAESAMWSGIAARIEAPAIPIETVAARRPTTGSVPARFRQWRRPLVAAAALVLVTASVTYEVTSKVVASEGQTQRPVASQTSSSPADTRAGAVPAPSGTSVAATSGSGGGGGGACSGADPLNACGGSNNTALAANPNASTGQRGLTPHVIPVRSNNPKRVYEREINDLRRILDERRTELDSSTVAVLERNLAVIDSAIVQSRAALRRDPRSRFLDQQLNSALDKKLELLRTAALLPART